jgi:diaminohydroxyphosphoribosylaminopyrimidine deaminase/5-amino-6-(5-phosphoribosylamino)uracil reductase
MADPRTYMRSALALARKGEGRTSPNPPVGALVVRDGKILGKGFHPRAGEPHGEIFALRQAGAQARGADLYVTLEPCSHHGRTGPCVEAVIAAGIAQVYIGVQDPNPRVAGRGIERLRAAGIAVTSGILETDCRRLIAPFAKHVTTGLPYVTLKTAVTLDGFTATTTGDSQWITGERSRQYVHRLRDRVDAIMAGIGTVLRDDPRLTTRLPRGGRDPLRVVLDSRLRLPGQASVVTVDSSAPTLVATTDLAPPEKVRDLSRQGVEVLQLPRVGERVDLAALLAELGERDVQSVLLEGGATLNRDALRLAFVDRLMVFVAPVLLGGNDGKGIFAGPGVARLAEAFRLRDVRVRRFGVDTLIEGEVDQCSPV